MHKKKLIITGASGFIASEFLKIYKNPNFEIFLISRKQPKNIKGLEFKKIDLRNYYQTKKYLETINPNLILHLADSKNRIVNLKNNLKKYKITDDDNIIIADNLIKICRKLNNLEKFIHIGSCDEYGDSIKILRESSREKPIKYYGKYKLKITQKFIGAFVKFKFPVVIVRPSVIYGKGQDNEMFIPSLIQSLKNNKTFYMSSGEQYRDFLYIDDFVDGLIKLIKNKDKKILGKKFNFSYGKSHKIKKIVDIAMKMIPINKDIIKFNSKKITEELVMNYFIDNNKSKKYFNWKPKVDIISGIKKLK